MIRDFWIRESNFPSLREQVVSTIVDELVEKQAAVMGMSKDTSSTGRASKVTSFANNNNGAFNNIGLTLSISKETLIDDGAIPASYANKLSLTSLTKANLRKLDANVPNDVYYDVWLPLASFHEVKDRMKHSPYGYFIGKKLAFAVVEWFVRNNWEKYELKKVTFVKCFFFFKFSSTEGVDSMLRGGLWMIRGIPIFLNKRSPSVSFLKEDLFRVSMWVKFHDVPIGFLYIRWFKLDRYENCDNLVMAVPNLEENGYMKETFRVEYEWNPPRCSTYLIFSHSFDDCPKSPKQVVNNMHKGKGGSSGVDDEGFVEVKTRNQVKNVLISSNGTFSLSNSFEALNVDTSVSEEVEAGNKASTSSVQEVRQSFTPIVEKINMSEKQLLEKECMLVDDDGKPLKKVDYSGNQDSEDEIEYVNNEMASYLASKPSKVGYGTKSLLEQ
ncbi:zinc knuckle CX2CX4HX4C containing protein [Tanacetum coccineum]